MVRKVSVVSGGIGFKIVFVAAAVRFPGTRPPVGLPWGMNVNLNYVLSVLWFILWLVALVDCLKGNSPNKLVWVVVIILLPFLGSILYFALGKSRA